MPKKNASPLQLKIRRNNAASVSSGHSNQYQEYCMRVVVVASFTESRGYINTNSLLWLTNSRTKEHVVAKFIIHWSWKGRALYFCTDGSVTADDFNRMFKRNDEILVSHANIGKPFEDNLALTYVHGTQEYSLDQRYATTRVRVGAAFGDRRDYTAWTNNARIHINPGDTYVSQQFMVTGELSEMKSIASSWKSEVYEDLYPIGEMSGTDIHLYSLNGATFGALVLEDGAYCSQGEIRCIGKSVPQHGLKPLFAMNCGKKYYVGSDKYYFSPSRASETDIIRSYACEDEANDIRPEWKLLGFFEEGSCDFVKNAVYDGNFCSEPIQSEYYLWPGDLTGRCPEGSDVPEEECLKAGSAIIEGLFDLSEISKPTTLRVDAWDYTPCDCFIWQYIDDGDSKKNLLIDYNNGTAPCITSTNGRPICKVPSPDDKRSS